MANEVQRIGEVDTRSVAPVALHEYLWNLDGVNSLVLSSSNTITISVTDPKYVAGIPKRIDGIDIVVIVIPEIVPYQK